MDATEWANEHLKGWDEESRASFVPLVEDLTDAGREAVAVEIGHLGNGQSTMSAVAQLVENLRELPAEKVEPFLATRQGLPVRQQRAWRIEIMDVAPECIVAYRSAVAGMDASMRSRLRAAVERSPEPVLLLKAAGHIKVAQERVSWAERAAGLNAKALQRNKVALKNLSGTDQVIAARNNPAAVAALPNYGLASSPPEVELQMRLAVLRNSLGAHVERDPRRAAELAAVEWPVGISVSRRTNVGHVPDLMNVFTRSQDPFVAMFVRAGLYMPSDEKRFRLLPVRELGRASQLADLATTIPDAVRPTLVEWRGALSSVLRHDGGSQLDALGLVTAVTALAPGARAQWGRRVDAALHRGVQAMSETPEADRAAKAAQVATAALVELRSSAVLDAPEAVPPGMQRALDLATEAVAARAQPSLDATRTQAFER